MYDYGYGYDYGYTDYDAVSGILGGFAAMMGVILLISSVVSILMLVSLWKIYKKAGKKGWEAIVPIYNIVVLLQIVELPTWYLVLFIVPFANIYAMFKIYIELAHKFGKSTGFGVATVFFSIICLPILAFGKNNVYNGNNNDSMTMNNNIQTPTTQYNPNTAFASQNQVNSMDNNMNSNDLNNQQPFMFNQNINTEINQIPAVQNTNDNMQMGQMNQVNPIPQPNTFGQTTPNLNNPTMENQPMNNQASPLPNVQAPQESAFKYEVPTQPVNPQPEANVMPGMGNVQQPMQNQNNNPFNQNM